MKLPTGFALDTATADVDFNALLSGLGHVLYPVFYHEAAKLLDLEHDHEFYHVSINELLFSILPRPLRGNALSVYHDCGRSSSPQLALIRRLGDRHQKIKPSYADADRVADLWHILSESAKKTPYVAPFYLVVLCELRAGHVFTFARLALRIRTAFWDESPLATLSRPSDTSPPGSGYRPKGEGRKPDHPSSSRPTAMALRSQKQSAAALDGSWVADSPASLYRKWVGAGYPCTVSFRMWNITETHPDTRGACPYVCKESFANNKHLETSQPAAPRPPLGASAASLSAPPPAAAPQVPAAEETPAAAFHSVRLTDPAPSGDPITGNTDGKHPVVPAASDDASPLLEETPACCSAALHDEDFEWPAFRSSPVWLPKLIDTTETAGPES
ncbi:hypothetical protein CYMTET_23103 [Cymbomonas tetramitiformis]|uniref:Uncharacterized protein n=1 Tax=Cymbomonas tetramitiformis TaxID=36881 RepID=A0AAE0FZ49_9CHLO|nr:hypothetical protein CYMTET_23103 [Cymbomonas tetramitiformis]